MIPKNINKEHILRAIAKIDDEGVPNHRKSKKYSLWYLGRVYPPKYTVALANVFANGEMLDAEDFSGGKETNDFLMNFDFEITSSESKIEKRNSPDQTKVAKLKATKSTTKKIIFKDELLRIATVIIQSPEYRQPGKRERKKLLSDLIQQFGKSADVILLPAGFLKENKTPDYKYVESIIADKLNKEDLNTIVCLGIDGRNDKDQLALAVDRNGIISLARKFYPTDGERDSIDLAINYLSLENGFERMIKIKGKRLYMAVCYDVYGIKERENPNVDGILNLVHRFNPKGYGSSGESYFAKNGFAGASKHWKCPVFGAVTFFMRNIPEKWPSGVLWNQGNKEVKAWRYDDNGINPINEVEVNFDNEQALIRYFSF
ncbi:MAG: hypothetical protein PWP56_2388 [Acetobacterium sp.]|jgi:hypothetical protein|nr:hypothetical protein [Acetobacterium sp.]